MSILVCSGNSFERGRFHGDKLKLKIRNNIYTFFEEVRAQGHRKEEIIAKANNSQNYLGTELIEEIDGIAIGASLPFKEVLAYNLFSETYLPEECTVMMAVGKASPTGSTIFLKNSDKKGYEHYVGTGYHKHKEINVVVAIQPDEGFKFVGVAAD